jgi:hypothetical protein
MGKVKNQKSKLKSAGLRGVNGVNPVNEVKLFNRLSYVLFYLIGEHAKEIRKLNFQGTVLEPSL